MVVSRPQHPAGQLRSWNRPANRNPDHHHCGIATITLLEELQRRALQRRAHHHCGIATITLLEELPRRNPSYEKSRPSPSWRSFSAENRSYEKSRPSPSWRSFSAELFRTKILLRKCAARLRMRRSWSYLVMTRLPRHGELADCQHLSMTRRPAINCGIMELIGIRSGGRQVPLERTAMVVP